MHFEIISQSFVQRIVEAICLTLIHSLWQGLFVAVFAGVMLLLTKKAKPALRYNLLSLLLFGFLIVNGVTFFRELNAKHSPASDFSGNVWLSERYIFDDVISGTGNATSPSFENSWIDAVMQFSSTHASMIVAIWLLVFSIKSMQAAAGLFYIQKVRKNKVSEVSETWKNQFDLLCKKLKISQAVRLVESTSISVPMVIGVLKPVVLLPVGLVSNLSVSQVEAILLHELAHIKRRDYLVNLIQVGSESVFFFNPMLLWLSYLIREEREHCCDDLAISVMENKTSFIHALVSFQEYNLSASPLQMAFSKKRNHLLDRIKRIIYNNNKPLNAMEKLFVTISLVTAAALSAALTQAIPPQKLPTVPPRAQQEFVSQAPVQHRVVAVQDTLPSKKKAVNKDIEIHSADIYTPDEGVSTYHVHADGKEYEMVQKNGKTASLKVDGKEIPESEFSSYQPEIDKIIAQVKVAHENAEEDRRAAEKMRAEAEVHRHRADIERKKAEENRVQADVERGKAEQNRVLADAQRDEAEKMGRYAEQQRLVADKLREEANGMRAEAEKQRAEAEVHRKEAEKDRQEYEKMQTGLINDLIESGVIKSKANLSYRLSQDELVVNGVKQSADLHQKLKAKYIKDRRVEMVYNYSGRTGYTTTGFIYTR